MLRRFSLWLFLLELERCCFTYHVEHRGVIFLFLHYDNRIKELGCKKQPLSVVLATMA
nr:MAG TPA: hypothetical protein [Bacteriophage sp.]